MHNREVLILASKVQQDKAWENAKRIRGKDPYLYRQDPYGNPMFRPSYGKSSEMGWEVDHIKPKSQGGSDATTNLQALNTSANRSLRDSIKKRSRHSS